MKVKKNGTVISTCVLLLLLFAALSLPAASYEANEDGLSADKAAFEEEKEGGNYSDLLESAPSYTVTYDEVHEILPYESVLLPSDTIPYNERQVMCEGREGEKVMLYEVRTYENGESERTLLSTEVILPAIDELIYYGCDRAVPYNEFIYPTLGKITSYYGMRVLGGVSKNHYGLDIANRLGTDISAADSGIVSYAGENGSYGLCIIIDHQNGYSTCYGHLSKISVEVGQRVARGDIIAKMGDTGNATGSHLHFEIRKNGDKVDPLLYLPEEPSEK